MRYKTTVTVTLDCDVETHVRSTFQNQGHFCPSTCTGPEVVAFNLMSPTGTQLLRVMANTEAECQDLMADAVRNYIWTSGADALQRDFSYVQYASLVQERGQLAMFLAEQYSWEIAHGAIAWSTGPVHIAVHFLKRERRRLWVRLRRLLLPKPSPPAGSDWLPDEWRKP